MTRSGSLSYRVWYYPSLTHDQDQRDNASAARRQRVQLLFARSSRRPPGSSRNCCRCRWRRSAAGWTADPALALYRFAVDDLFRQQEHVLDQEGERLLSLSSRLRGAPNDVYEALSTADASFPTITLSHRRQRAGAPTATTGGVLATSRVAADRARRLRRPLRRLRRHPQHLRVALQRRAAARLVPGPGARLRDDARGRALRQRHPDRGRRPRSSPRRRPAWRRSGATTACGSGCSASTEYHACDTSSRSSSSTSATPTTTCARGSSSRRRRLGADYQRRVREAFAGGWIDVYENQGKRSGAYSAPVYGAHPVHAAELQRHARRRVHARPRDGPLDAHAAVARAQPFVYAGYTIFVAEVPSTLERGAAARASC